MYRAFGFLSSIVGLWRSWERASMAWKRSSVRSRPGPPNFPLVADTWIDARITRKLAAADRSAELAGLCVRLIPKSCISLPELKLGLVFLRIILFQPEQFVERVYRLLVDILH